MSIASPARGFVCVTLAAVLFAVNASVSKVVLDAGIDPARLTAVRCTGAELGLSLVLLAVAPGRLRVTTRELPALVGLGLAGAAMVQWLYFVAIDRLPVGVALLLEFTPPALVALYAQVVRREYVRSRTWLAIGLAFGGVALVAQVWRDSGLDPLGVAAGLGAALCLATYLLVGGRTATTRDAASLTFYMFAFGAAFWAIAQPWWVFETAPFGDLISLRGVLDTFVVPVWLGVGWVVVLGTLVPYALYLGALRHIPPTAAGIVGMSDPVAGAAIAWAWLGQALTAVQITGGAIVLAGVALAQQATATRATAERAQGDLARIRLRSGTATLPIRGPSRPVPGQRGRALGRDSRRRRRGRQRIHDNGSSADDPGRRGGVRSRQHVREADRHAAVASPLHHYSRAVHVRGKCPHAAVDILDSGKAGRPVRCRRILGRRARCPGDLGCELAVERPIA
ncbi:MAG TPA: DMT family transporter [Jiangellaceae bacterium]|nr:DMT family transporter [Jiangellaceae bacterium]